MRDTFGTVPSSEKNRELTAGAEIIVGLRRYIVAASHQSGVAHATPRVSHTVELKSDVSGPRSDGGRRGLRCAEMRKAPFLRPQLIRHGVPIRMRMQ